jgi:hypothetical protein
VRAPEIAVTRDQLGEKCQLLWIGAESGTPPPSDATICKVLGRVDYDGGPIGADWDPRTYWLRRRFNGLAEIC